MKKLFFCWGFCLPGDLPEDVQVGPKGFIDLAVGVIQSTEGYSGKVHYVFLKGTFMHSVDSSKVPVMKGHAK
jgi:hypothetical protein